MRHSILRKKTWKVTKVLKGNMKPCVLRKNSWRRMVKIWQSSGLGSQKQIVYPIIDIKEEIEVKDEIFYTNEENMESGQGFEEKYETLFIKEGVMEENGQGHGQDFGQSSGLDGSQMKIFYPIINVNEKIEAKDDKLNIKEEDVSDDRIYEVKENTLYIKEEIMENGQDQGQGQGFDQSSGLDESQVGIKILNESH
ncbi:hypothetical protein Avbf_06204 [Armadillidium vulgare]|nr:hypothetical protein Avbf_06204 [Armadillidium vulgare]